MPLTTPCTVTTDVQMLKRVTDNLLSNIEKYADPAARLTILAECENGRLHICFANRARKELARVESNHIGLRTCEAILQLLGGQFFTHRVGDDFRLSLSCRSRRRTRMGKRAARRMTVVAVPKASAPRVSPMGQGTPRLRFGIASGETFPLRSEIRCALFKPSPKGEGGAAIRQVSSDAGRIIGAAGENRGLSTASASLRSAPSRQGEGSAHANCSRGEKA